MERPKMTTETNSAFNTVKEAFAPVTDAFKNIQNLEVPEAAREFVKKTAGTAKERAGQFREGLHQNRLIALTTCVQLRQFEGPLCGPSFCGALASSLRATGSRECAPDDRLREAIHLTIR